MNFTDAQLGPAFAHDAETYNLAKAIQGGRELMDASFVAANSHAVDSDTDGSEFSAAGVVTKTLTALALVLAFCLFAYVAVMMALTHL